MVFEGDGFELVEEDQFFDACAEFGEPDLDLVVVIDERHPIGTGLAWDGYGGVLSRRRSVSERIGGTLLAGLSSDRGAHQCGECQ